MEQPLLAGVDSLRRVSQRIARTWRQRTIIVAALATIGSAWLWAPTIGAYLIVADPLTPADGIVPLAGDPVRIDYAAELFKRGYAPWFVATSMRLDDPTAEPFAFTVRRSALRDGVAPERIVIAPGVAATTYQEAMMLRRLAIAKQWRSLIVVTSPSHTRRARTILRDIFTGSGVAIMVRPVTPHWYSGATWWRSRAGVRETVLEYGKLMLYWLGYHRGEQPA